MKIFQATVTANVAGFETAVTAAYGHNSLKISENSWLIAGNGTAQEICGTLGMPTTQGQPSPFSALVVGVNGYYGWVGSNIWEWMASKQAIDA